MSQNKLSVLSGTEPRLGCTYPLSLQFGSSSAYMPACMHVGFSFLKPHRFYASVPGVNPTPDLLSCLKIIKTECTISADSIQTSLTRNAGCILLSTQITIFLITLQCLGTEINEIMFSRDT